jgi:uncharacterized protein YecE (DUF72 family)
MTEAEWTEWSRTHKACWEVGPLVDLHEGRKVQVGFEFSIFAQFPATVTSSDERMVAFPKLRAQLEELAAAVFPAEGPVARFEVAPIETAVRLRSEAEFAPEMLLTVRVFHKQEYFQAVDASARQRLAPLEDRLKAHGLKARAWGRSQ